MNCKPGDLAVVVVSTHSPENIGCLVHVLHRYVAGEEVAGTSWTLTAAAWVVESAGRPLSWGVPGRTKTGRSRQRVYADACLRPIRDQDGADETLVWKTLQVKEPA